MEDSSPLTTSNKRKKTKDCRAQTPQEELINSITHGFGLLLALIGLVNLVIHAFLHGTAIHLITVNIFCGSMIVLYASSTAYHGVVGPRLKHICRVLDHCSIFILIAGTYTPVALLMLPPAWGWTLFGIQWGLAAVGVTFKLFFTGKYDIVSTVVYLGMGWMAIVAAWPIYESLPAGGLLLMVAGGLSYSLGVVFYRMDKMLYAHAIWHLFVMGGTVCHYLMIALYCIPNGPPILH